MRIRVPLLCGFDSLISHLDPDAAQKIGFIGYGEVYGEFINCAVYSRMMGTDYRLR